MAIDKKLIHFKTKENFISQGVGSEENVTKPTEGSEENGNAIYGQLKGTSIVFIKDSNEIWTHGNLYKSVNWSVLENTPSSDKSILILAENIDTNNRTFPDEYLLDNQTITEISELKLTPNDSAVVLSGNSIKACFMMVLSDQKYCIIGGISIDGTNARLENNSLILLNTVLLNYDADQYAVCLVSSDSNQLIDTIQTPI